MRLAMAVPMRSRRRFAAGIALLLLVLLSRVACFSGEQEHVPRGEDPASWTSAAGARSQEVSGSFRHRGRIGMQLRQRVAASSALQSPQSRPFGVQISSTLKQDLPAGSSLLSQLENSLLPAASAYLARLLTVKSASAARSPLLLAPGCATPVSLSNGSQACSQNAPFCNAELQLAVDPALVAGYTLCSSQDPASCTATPAGAGAAADVDLVLFVSALSTSVCRGASPPPLHGSFCTQDIATGRPTSAYLNFCPEVFPYSLQYSSAFDSQLGWILHELFHSLAMNSALYSRFLNLAGQPQAAVVSTAAGVSSIVTPMVVAAARAHFACPSIKGVPLEAPLEAPAPAPGAASAPAPSASVPSSTVLDAGESQAHWSSTWAAGDIMTASLEATPVVSNITLALLEDSGWYTVTRSMAGFLNTGYSKGCAFTTGSCAPQSVSGALSSSFCSQADLSRTATFTPQSGGQALQSPMNSLCSSNHMAVATCSSCSPANPAGCLSGNCMYKAPVQGKQCRDAPSGTGLASSSTLFGESYGLGSRCMLQGNSYYVSVFGAGAVAPPGAGCYSVQCTKAPGVGGAFVLKVNLGGTWHVCPEGKLVTDISFSPGSVGPCPNAADVCRGAMCPKDCSGKGQCWDGVCYCQPGYSGADCSQVACSTSSLASTLACPASAQCSAAAGVCVGPSGAPVSMGLALAPPASPPPPLAPPSPPASPSPPYAPPEQGSAPPGPSATPQYGVNVHSLISFGGANISTISDSNSLAEFQTNFRQQMSASAQQLTGYTGQLEVKILAIYSGSILVESSVWFAQAQSFSLPQEFADTLVNKPAVVFAGSPFFIALPSGVISSSNVTVSAASQSTSSNSSSGPLGISYLAWAGIAGSLLIIAIVLLVVLSRRASRRRMDALLYEYDYDGYYYPEGDDDYYEEFEDMDPLEAYAQLVAEAQLHQSDVPPTPGGMPGQIQASQSQQRISIPAFPPELLQKQLTHRGVSAAYPRSRTVSGPMFFGAASGRSGPIARPGGTPNAPLISPTDPTSTADDDAAAANRPPPLRRLLKSVSGPLKIVWATAPPVEPKQPCQIPAKPSLGRRRSGRLRVSPSFSGSLSGQLLQGPGMSGSRPRFSGPIYDPHGFAAPPVMPASSRRKHSGPIIDAGAGLGPVAGSRRKYSGPIILDAAGGAGPFRSRVPGQVAPGPSLRGVSGPLRAGPRLARLGTPAAQRSGPLRPRTSGPLRGRSGPLGPAPGQSGLLDRSAMVPRRASRRSGPLGQPVGPPAEAGVGMARRGPVSGPLRVSPRGARASARSGPIQRSPTVLPSLSILNLQALAAPGAGRMDNPLVPRDLQPSDSSSQFPPNSMGEHQGVDPQGITSQDRRAAVAASFLHLRSLGITQDERDLAGLPDGLDSAAEDAARAQGPWDMERAMLRGDVDTDNGADYGPTLSLLRPKGPRSGQLGIHASGHLVAPGAGMRKVSSTPALDAMVPQGQSGVLGYTGGRSGQIGTPQGGLSGPKFLKPDASRGDGQGNAESLPTPSEFARLNRSGQLKMLAQISSPSREIPSRRDAGGAAEVEMVTPPGRPAPLRRLRHSASLAVDRRLGAGDLESGPPGTGPTNGGSVNLGRPRTRSRVYWAPTGEAVGVSGPINRSGMLRSGQISRPTSGVLAPRPRQTMRRVQVPGITTQTGNVSGQLGPVSGQLRRLPSRRGGPPQHSGLLGVPPALEGLDTARLEEMVRLRRMRSKAVSGPLYFA